MRILVISFLFLYSYNTFSQIVTTIDSESGQKIAHVLIYDEDSGWSVATNDAGKADISTAPVNALLVFQHPSYQKVILSRESIKNNIEISLREKILHVQEVVISANKWEQDLEKIPQEIVSINRKTVEENQPQTSADMLESTGQVFVQKSQLGGGSPMLRGFAANNVLLVVDGVRMNNAIYRSGNLQNVINIDPLALEGTEVVFGPGSVIYGSDALGGVMDFHTITPSFGIDKTLLSGQVLIRHSTANKEKTGHLNFTLGRPDFSFFSSISYNNFDDQRAGKNYLDNYPDYGKNQYMVIRENNTDKIISNPNPNVQSPSGFNLFSTINKLRYRKNNLDLTYGFYYSSTGNIPRFDRHLEVDDNNLPVFAEWYYGPQRWMMNSLKGEYFKGNFLFDRLRIIVANQQVEESRHSRKIGNELRRNQFEEVDIWSLNIDMDKQFTKSELYYGFEVVSNFVESNAYLKNIVTEAVTNFRSRYPSDGSSWSSYAAYGSYVYDFGKTQLSSGLRYSFIHLEAKNQNPGPLGFEDISLNNSAITGSIGVTHKLTENWRIRGSLSNGFRAPNIDDIGKIFEVSENTISVPNENLKAQFTYSAEVGVSFRSDKWLIDLTTYQTWVDQVMTRTPFNINGNDSIIIDGTKKLVVALTNSGNAKILGIISTIKHELNSHLALESFFTYTWGEEISGEPLRHVPPTFGKFNLIYRKAAFTGRFYIDYNFRKEADEIPLSERTSKPHLFAFDGSTPGWYTLNISGAYRFKKGFITRIFAENLLDLNYRTYSSGISAQGRNFSFSLSKSF